MQVGYEKIAILNAYLCLASITVGPSRVVIINISTVEYSL